MKFVSVASPKPAIGCKTGGIKLTVPNQAMSLEEILERFVRGEPVNVGKDPVYDDGDEDLEKLSHMDLVDKAEYVERLKDTQKAYKKQEADKVKAEKERLKAEAIAEAKKEAEKAAKAELKP